MRGGNKKEGASKKKNFSETKSFLSVNGTFLNGRVELRPDA